MDHILNLIGALTLVVLFGGAIIALLTLSAQAWSALFRKIGL